MVTVGPELLERFPRFSLYNSPYTAHEEGCAIDLYPHGGDWRESKDDCRETAALSPVAGEVVATRSVSAPTKPYAVEEDHLIVVDTGDYLARMLHEPTVEPGDKVALGDSLGEMVRSGFFAQWVDNHIHLGFRDLDANPFRASGSLSVEIDPGVELAGVPWDGRGEVVATGETYAILDAPNHPAPGERFAGIRTEVGGIIDGGFPHYEGGGLLAEQDGEKDGETGPTGPVSLAGQQVGTAEGRTIAWEDLTVLANETPITGLSFFFARETLGAKLVCPDVEFEVGQSIEIALAVE